MNINEAYKIIECSRLSSEEDLKKKYKELAKKYHPDIYKEDPNKFKQINEAFQFIKDYENNSTQETSFNISDIFGGGFRQQVGRNVSNITLEQDISFEESILGVEKEIKISRDIKCDSCNGRGFKQKKNDCAHCDGFGRTSVRRDNMVFNAHCSQCRGQNTKEDCQDCNTKTFTTHSSTLKIKIPPGVIDKNIIQLQGAGHYAHSSIFGDVYSNILMTINVKNNTQLKLDGSDVIFNLNISLLEALQGCSKLVPSIKGDQTIEVPANSRNKEEIIINNFGVALKGNERVILDVSYPENKDKLILALKEGI